MPLNTGQLINNRYRIVKLLGQGGFGAVYRAWDVNLNKVVALKENLDTSQPAQVQFTHEANILANLSHPNLPRVTDHFLLSGQGQYLVMDFIAGDDLEQMLHTSASGILPEKQVLIWVLQVLDALSYLHSRQPAIIHRDLKPANIKIQPEGTAILVDFGIAKVFDAHLKTTLGARAVTPGFSPPEQYGHSTTDSRSDIYALGAVMYAVLTGQDPPESVQRTIGTNLINPRAFNPTLTIETEKVILRAMELKPGDRYQKADDFRDAIQATAMQPNLASSQPFVAATVVAPTQIQSVPPVINSVAPPPVIPISTPLSQQSYQVTARRKPRWFPVLIILALLFMFWRLMILFQHNPLPLSTSQPTHASAWLPNPTNPATGLPVPTIVPAGDPSLGIGSTQVSPVDGMVMAYIPGGEFLMGAPDSDSHAGANEKPFHRISLNAFWIYQTEVTNAMYKKCVDSNACQAPDFVKSETRPHYYDSDQFKDYPVIFVSWLDAFKYCQWSGGRLPSEAEWEKAARGGLVSKLFPWGDDLPVCTSQAQNGANFPACSLDDTRPVKYFSPNGYGLYDVAGNVAEWVNDWFDEKYYTTFPQNAWPDNPAGPVSGDFRVLRGASWNASAYNLRVSYRYGEAPNVSDYYIGFRCVR